MDNDDLLVVVVVVIGNDDVMDARQKSNTITSCMEAFVFVPVDGIMAKDSFVLFFLLLSLFLSFLCAPAGVSQEFVGNCREEKQTVRFR